jgi:capsular polysaccharide biosynthesis protein
MEKSQTTGMTSYLVALRRRRRLMALVALPVILGSLVLAFALPDIYESSGLVNIEQERVEGVRSSTKSASDDYVQEYVRSVASTLLTVKGLTPAVESLELYPDLKGDLAAAAGRMAEDTRIDVVRSTILDPGSGREREIISGFRISYENRDPQAAFRGASWLTTAFLQEERSKRASRESETAKFFSREAERVSEDVMKLEQKFADFRRRNYSQLPESSAANLGSMDRLERDMENAQMQLQQLRRDRVFIQQRLAEANSTYGNADQLARAEEELRRKSATYDASHPDIISLRRQIETLRLAGSTNGAGGNGASLQDQLASRRATLVQTQQRYSEDHPDVRRIKREVEELERRIAAGESNRATSVRTAASEQLVVQLQSTDSQIDSLQSRIIQLRSKMGTFESRMAAVPEVEREAQILTRDIGQARIKYEQLQASRMDAEITKAAIEQGKADEFRVMQQPFSPVSPAKPRRAAISLIGLILGLVLALSAVGVAELLDPTVRNSRDLQEVLSVMPLAVVPRIQNQALAEQQRRTLRVAGVVVTASLVVVFLLIRLWGTT